MFCLPKQTNERTLRRLSVDGKGAQAKSVFAVPNENAWFLECAQHVSNANRSSNFLISLESGLSGENGAQTCNACRAVLAQAVLRKRAAASNISRLEPLRKNCVGPTCYARHGKRLQNTDKNARARP